MHRNLPISGGQHVETHANTAYAPHCKDEEESGGSSDLALIDEPMLD